MRPEQEQFLDRQWADARPIRIGLIGAGIFAQEAHAPSILRQPERLQVVAVYSRTEERAAKLAAQFSQPEASAVRVYTALDAMLDDPDVEAVDILLPIGNLPDAVERALRAGKHVLSEKPIAPTVATAEALLEVSAHHPGQVWMVGENWRYEDAFAEAGNLIGSGRIGKPILCQWALHSPITDNHKYYHTSWRIDQSFPGGFLLDGGVHHAAALRLVMGEVAEVSAVVQRASTHLPTADTLAASLRFANGALGSYAVTYAAGASWEPWLCVTGSEGTLRVQRNALEIEVGEAREQIAFTGFNGVEEELVAFAEAIRFGRAHINTPQAALADLALVEGMLRSAQTGARVVLG